MVAGRWGKFCGQIVRQLVKGEIKKLYFDWRVNKYASKNIEEDKRFSGISIFLLLFNCDVNACIMLCRRDGSL